MNNEKDYNLLYYITNFKKLFEDLDGKKYN